MYNYDMQAKAYFLPCAVSLRVVYTTVSKA